jgi:hypothetical protein
MGPAGAGNGNTLKQQPASEVLAQLRCDTLARLQGPVGPTLAVQAQLHDGVAAQTDRAQLLGQQ